MTQHRRQHRTDSALASHLHPVVRRERCGTQLGARACYSIAGAHSQRVELNGHPGFSDEPHVSISPIARRQNELPCGVRGARNIRQAHAFRHTSNFPVRLENPFLLVRGTKRLQMAAAAHCNLHVATRVCLSRARHAVGHRGTTAAANCVWGNQRSLRNANLIAAELRQGAPRPRT